MFNIQTRLHFSFIRLVLILNSKKVIEDALINNFSAFSGRSKLYTEAITNPNSKGKHIIYFIQSIGPYHLTIRNEHHLYTSYTANAAQRKKFEIYTQWRNYVRRGEAAA